MLFYWVSFCVQNFSIYQNPLCSRPTLNTWRDFQRNMSTLTALHRHCGKVLEALPFWSLPLTTATSNPPEWLMRSREWQGLLFLLPRRKYMPHGEGKIHLSAIRRFPWKITAIQRNKININVWWPPACANVCLSWVWRPLPPLRISQCMTLSMKLPRIFRPAYLRMEKGLISSILKIVHRLSQ